MAYKFRGAKFKSENLKPLAVFIIKNGLKTLNNLCVIAKKLLAPIGRATIENTMGNAFFFYFKILIETL